MITHGHTLLAARGHNGVKYFLKSSTNYDEIGESRKCMVIVWPAGFSRCCPASIPYLCETSLSHCITNLTRSKSCTSSWSSNFIEFLNSIKRARVYPNIEFIPVNSKLLKQTQNHRKKESIDFPNSWQTSHLFHINL